MTLKRHFILFVVLFVVVFVIGQLARQIVKDPGQIAIVIKEGSSDELGIRRWQDETYVAELRVKNADLAKLPVQNSLSASAAPNNPISMKVAVVDAQGTTRFEQDFEVGSDSSSFSADDRSWTIGRVDLTSGRQIIRVTVLRAEPHLDGLPASIDVGRYPKSCSPGLDCIAVFLLVLLWWPTYLIFGIWLFGLVVVSVARGIRAQ